jgi:hypothetical protein
VAPPPDEPESEDFPFPFPLDFASLELPDEDDELVLEDDPSVAGAELPVSPVSLDFPGAEPELPGLSDAPESATSLGEVVVVSVVSSASVESTSVDSSVTASWPLLLSLAFSLFEKPGPTATIKSDASALQTAATRNCFHQTVRLAIPSLPLQILQTSRLPGASPSLSGKTGWSYIPRWCHLWGDPL